MTEIPATDKKSDKKKSYRKVRWIIPGLISLFFLCLLPEVIIGLFIVAGLIAFGWGFFLARVGPQIELDHTGLAIAIASLLLLVLGIQRLVSHRDPAWKLSQTVRCVLGVLGVFLGGICLVGLGHEISWMGRSTTPWMYLRDSWDDSLRPRIKSKAHLKQIGLAVHAYYDLSNAYPPGGVFQPDGTARHGWMTMLLPYLDQNALYQQVQFDRPWYHIDNRKVFETRVPDFDDPRVRPSRVQPGGYAPTFYAANDRVLNANSTMGMGNIKDGLSNTIFAGEVNENIRPWGDVVNWRNFELGINQSPDGFGSLSKGGILVLMTDGSARTLSDKIDSKTLRALATPNAGDEVGDLNE